MEVVRTEPEALTGCRWMVILTTKPVVYKNAGAMASLERSPASGVTPTCCSSPGRHLRAFHGRHDVTMLHSRPHLTKASREELQQA